MYGVIGRRRWATAQQLFVTVKPVEVHLSHVYRELDIEARRQLRRALADAHAQPSAVG